jgi:hypothetical protein
MYYPKVLRINKNYLYAMKIDLKHKNCPKGQEKTDLLIILKHLSHKNYLWQ